MIDDAAFLRQYLDNGSQAAFAELVQRHLDLVYATALRKTRAHHRARDITQSVFTDLHRKAKSLAGRKSVAGWLYLSAQLAAMKLARQESRRERREQRAEEFGPTAPEPTVPIEWNRVAPLLDSVLVKLPPADREAILLRFFQQATFADVGAFLNVSENSARMRVSRAVEKARKLLTKQGITSSAAAIELVLSAHAATTAAPLSAAAIASGAMASATAGASTGTALFLSSFMSSSKITIGLLAVAAIAGVGTALNERNHRHVAEAGLEQITLRRDDLQEKLRAANALLLSLNTRDSLTRSSGKAAFQATASRLRDEARAPLPSLSDPANADRIAQYRRRYNQFFQQRGLTPAQADQFIQLCLEWDDLHSDLQAGVREQGLSDESNNSGVEQLRSELFKPLEREFQSLLGDDGYAAYNAYQRTAFWSGIIQPITDGLAASDLSLTAEQMNRLNGLVEANNHPVHENPSDLGTRISIDWDSVAAESVGILTPAQVAILQSKLPVLKRHQ
jgi:RNA polymerase sigma factor (sigma-70 family)